MQGFFGWFGSSSGSSSDMSDQIHNATEVSSILDADEVPFWKSVGGVLRKITWTNIKSTLGAGLQFLSTALSIKGSSTGKNILASANDGANDYTHTLQKASGIIAHLSDITGGDSSMTAETFAGSVKLNRLAGTHYSLITIINNNEIALDNTGIQNNGLAYGSFKGEGIHVPGFAAFKKRDNLGYDYDETLGMINVIKFWYYNSIAYYEIVDQYQVKILPYTYALYIAGAVNYVNIVSAPYTINKNVAFSILFRAKVANTTDYPCVFTLHDGTNPIVSIFFITQLNCIQFRFYSASGSKYYQTNGSDYTFNQWDFFAITYDGTLSATAAKFLINNVIRAYGVNTAGTYTTERTPVAISIGDIKWGGSPYIEYGVKVSDLVIADKALNDFELDESYNDGNRIDFRKATFNNHVKGYFPFNNDLKDYALDNDGTAPAPNFTTDI